MELPKIVIDYYNDILLKKQKATFVPDEYDPKALPTAGCEPNGKLVWVTREEDVSTK